MRRIFIGTLIAVAVLTKTDPGSAHVYSRLATVESIVDRGTYQIDDSIFIDTIDKVYSNGHFYSHQPPLLSTLEAPVYWVLRLPGTRFNNRGRFAMTYAFSLATNGVALALTVVAFAHLLALAGVASPLRDWFAVLLPMGTWLLPYGLVTNNHGIAGMLLAVLAYLLLLIEWHGINRNRAIATGLVSGLLVGIELLPIVSFAPLTLIYLVARRDVGRREWIAAGAGFGALLLIHAIINVRITGDVIPAGFHTELFNYPGSAFEGSSLSGGLKFHTLPAFGAYAWSSLFAGKGFFTFAPLTFVGVIAGLVTCRWWWQRARGPYLVLFGGAILSFLASLLTTNNFGGEAVGFRHAAYLAPSFVLMLLPWILDDAGRVRPRTYAVMGVAVVSLALIGVFATRDPWSSLTLTHAPVGRWDEYVQLAARIVHRDLFKP